MIDSDRNPDHIPKRGVYSEQTITIVRANNEVSEWITTRSWWLSHPSEKSILAQIGSSSPTRVETETIFRKPTAQLKLGSI